LQYPAEFRNLRVTDGDGPITRAKYKYFRKLFQKGRNAVLAIKPGGRGTSPQGLHTELGAW
jgi:hypothetical protein